MRRRDFLRTLGATVVVAAGCGGDDDDVGDTFTPTSAAADSDRVFPQGVASGEPHTDSIVLWTRITSAAEVRCIVASDEALTQSVTSTRVTASEASDFTVRLQLTGLSADTVYYYRFEVGGVTTQVGRTRTAPGADTDRAVTFAFASCQDFIGRRYHAWQALLDENASVDFVLFLGDYIYETVGDPQFQNPSADRSITLPDGLALDDKPGSTNKAALSLADYRTLYRSYRSDATLREVHRRYPFVILWDDHEFANDCWQDHSTDFAEAKGDEKNTARREAASQAWAEYQPVAVTRDTSKAFPDDLTIYRTLRYGKHVELFITDQRLYRSDHVIPEGPTDTAVGKIGANSSIGSRNFLLKKGFDPKEKAAAPTMLGATQKAWLLAKLPASNATWKVWANEVQLWQMALDLSSYESLPDTYRDRFYFSCDQWDGYRSERAEILAAFASVDNLVACTGDIHGFYAAELHVDFDAPGATPVGVEYVVAGISSQSTQELTRTSIEGNAAFKALGLLDLVPKLDEVLRSTNPYLRHSDTTANGVALATVSATSFDVVMIRTGDPTDAAATGVVSRTNLRTAAGSRTVVKS